MPADRHIDNTSYTRQVLCKETLVTCSTSVGDAHSQVAHLSMRVADDKLSLLATVVRTCISHRSVRLRRFLALISIF